MESATAQAPHAPADLSAARAWGVQEGEKSIRGLAESAAVLLGTPDPHHPPGPSLAGAPQTW